MTPGTGTTLTYSYDASGNLATRRQVRLAPRTTRACSQVGIG
jgi:YD repeat-containing protein